VKLNSELPSPIQPLAGLPVHPRCPRAFDRCRCAIDSVIADTANVTTKDGRTIALKASADLRVGAAQRTALGDIKPNDYVGVAWVRGSDGKPQCASAGLMALY
jgi:hypothetical protein